LMFNRYDFELNPLKIPLEILPTIKKQFERIYQIRRVDSWGVDFHKGLGGCPTPCGLFVSNNRNELLLLSKKERGIDTHHLGNDWSLEDPSDITLETSRSASEALSAVGSLLSMGKNGFRRFLANQIFYTKVFRDLISSENDFLVGNPHALGFNTMVLISPSNKKTTWKEFLKLVEDDGALLDRINEEVKLFYEFCLKSGGNIKRLGCSFSKSFYKTKTGKSVSGLKYCFVSPHMDFSSVKEEVEKLKKQLADFRISKKR
jgi:L-2,4-diaminobutyrate decarboxylase